MELNAIITRAAAAYPDMYVLKYWDAQKQCAVDGKGGDSLAEFVAWELYETFDPEVGDEQQLQTAIEKLRRAEQDLHAVVTALENLEQERNLNEP